MAERGRPRGFDRTGALDRALLTFWRNGFEATSMSDLVKAMEINSPSIYAAFGSKEQLFCEAVQRYRSHYAADVLPALNAQREPMAALSAMFEAAIDLFTSADRPQGCFIVTASAGNAPATPTVQEELARLRRERSDEIAARLRRDVAEGRLSSDLSVQALADMYAAILQGMAVAARDGVPRSRLSDLYSQSLRLVA